MTWLSLENKVTGVCTFSQCTLGSTDNYFHTWICHSQWAAVTETLSIIWSCRMPLFTSLCLWVLLQKFFSHQNTKKPSSLSPAFDNSLSKLEIKKIITKKIKNSPSNLGPPHWHTKPSCLTCHLILQTNMHTDFIPFIFFLQSQTSTHKLSPNIMFILSSKTTKN